MNQARSRRRSLVLLAVGLGLAGLGPLAQRSLGADVIVSSNARFSGIPDLDQIDAHAYHSDHCIDVHNDRNNPPNAKPVIISDDGAQNTSCNENNRGCSNGVCGGCQDGSTWNMPVNCVKWYTLKLKDQEVLGHRHYEHLSKPLSWAVEKGDFTAAEPLDSWDDLGSEDQDVLDFLGNHATPLAPWGRLSQDVSAGGYGRFLWNGSPIRLVGFSIYGPVVADHVDIPGYLDAIRWRQTAGGNRIGVNFTRIFVIDQWAGLRATLAQNQWSLQGRAPFALVAATQANPDPCATGLPWKPCYDLERFDEEYFSRLRLFVTEAWARGIVVQIALFDRNGVHKSSGDWGSWLGSPYNTNRNLAAQTFLNGTNPSTDHPDAFMSLPPGPSGGCYLAGSQDALVSQVNRRLIQRVVLELRDYPNVIFEVINESEQASRTPPVIWPHQDWFHEAVSELVESTAAESQPVLSHDDFNRPDALLANSQSSPDCDAIWKAGADAKIINQRMSHIADANGNVSYWALLPFGAVGYAGPEPDSASEVIGGGEPDFACCYGPRSGGILEFDATLPPQLTAPGFLGVGFASGTGYFHGTSTATNLFKKGRVWGQLDVIGNWSLHERTSACADGCVIASGTFNTTICGGGAWPVRLVLAPFSQGNHKVLLEICGQAVAPWISTNASLEEIDHAGFMLQQSPGLIQNTVFVDNFVLRSW